MILSACDLACVLFVVGWKFIGGKRLWLGFGMALDKALDLVVIFFPEHRTRHIQEFTTSGQQPPQGIDHDLLARRELRDIRFAPQPFDIRMAARHARC